MGLSKEQQKAVINQMLTEYEQKYFSLTLSMEIAEDAGNERLVDNIMEKCKEVKQAMKVLEDKL